MVIFVDGAILDLVELFCKACQFHAVRAVPNKCVLPKCMEWPGKYAKGSHI